MEDTGRALKEFVAAFIADHAAARRRAADALAGGHAAAAAQALEQVERITRQFLVTLEPHAQTRH